MTRCHAPALVLAGGGPLPPRVFDAILAAAPRARAEGPVQVLICTLASQAHEAAARAQAAFETSSLARKPGSVVFEALDFFSAPQEQGLTASEQATLFATKAQQRARLRAHAQDGHGLEALARAGVLWFTGGDQRLILDTLVDTPFEAEMMARWRAGTLLVAGTSAGLQVCSSIALTGDFHDHAPEPALEDAPAEADDTPLRTLGAASRGGAHPARKPGRGLVVTTRGFGFLEGVVLDQHFIRRQRHNRLLSACLDHPGSIGLGVDEGTALVVSREAADPTRGHAHVVGDSCVFHVDTRNANVDETASAHGLSCGLSWEGARLPFPLTLPS